MSGIRDQQNIDELRKRLYDRGGENAPTSRRRELTDIKFDVARGWGGVGSNEFPTPAPVLQTEAPLQESVAAPVPPPQPADLEADIVFTPVKKKRSYRLIVLLFSVGVFILAAIVSSFYLLMGANQISARNVNISISAPFAIAAGEVVTLQVSLSNQNSVPIESASLIVNYPSGTKSGDDPTKDLYEERLPIEGIKPGEAINIPVKAILFGEENEDKEIRARIEYRVGGSSGSFSKDAEAVKVKITSSPLVMRVKSVEKISSGQELEVEIVVQSNTATVQKDILIAASYPNSFTFSSSDPEPSYGQNSWLIDEIEPQSTKTIKLRGQVKGEKDEISEIQLTAGTPQSDNQYMMGGVLTKTKVSYTIEEPFLEVKASINGDSDGEAVIEPGKESSVVVKVVNTLDETIYDMRVEIAPKGNLIRDDNLNISSGYYESSSKTIRFDSSGMPTLATVLPGESREFRFTVSGDANQKTGSFDISTKVFARRVGEANASEELVGSVIASAKYSSDITLRSQVGHNSGPFSDTGPIPPKAEQATTYTVTFRAEGGVNDVTNATLTTTFPQHITWLDKTAGDGSVEFNSVSKQLRWNIGSIEAGGSQELQVQVSLLPSVTQVGKTATIVGVQEMSATDRFTNATLKVRHPAMTNELSTEAGFSEGNGIIESN
jgi:Domain of unknown function DUF11